MKQFVLMDEIPDENQKRCYDCRFMQGAITLWCMSDEATAYKGNKTVGYKHCQFWKPMLTVHDARKEFEKKREIKLSNRSKFSRFLDRIFNTQSEANIEKQFKKYLDEYLQVYHS